MLALCSEARGGRQRGPSLWERVHDATVETCDHRFPFWPLAFSHRVRAALRAISRRRSGVSLCARVLAPFLPSEAKYWRSRLGRCVTSALYMAAMHWGNATIDYA